MRKTVDGIVGIIIVSWPAVEVYVFDKPENVEIEWPDENWYHNDEYTDFKVAGAELTSTEPYAGSIINANGEVEEGDLDVCKNDNSKLIIDPEFVGDDETMEKYYKKGYDEAHNLLRKENNITYNEIIYLAERIARKYGGRVIIAIGP